ncbi:MAG: hypothetical protein JXB39_08805 [Deltaproteobacteria bacterium]|nr:hypothetical protein [Deltaproteobacteria bacterium]
MADPRQLLKTLGLHPLAAFSLVAVDWMLFSGDVASVGLTTAITVPVGFALGLGCALVQRHAFKDSWGAALGKGVVMGVLTAIPTGLPGILNAVGGGMGLLHLLRPSSDTQGAQPPRQIVDVITEEAESPRRIAASPPAPPPPVGRDPSDA